MSLHQQHPGTLADTQKKTQVAMTFWAMQLSSLHRPISTMYNAYYSGVVYTGKVYYSGVIDTADYYYTGVFDTGEDYFTGRIISPVTHSLNLYYKFKKGKKNLN
jgi:hypothetical protein